MKKTKIDQRVASEVSRLVAKAEKNRNPLKYYDLSQNNVVSTSGVYIGLGNIAQGTASNNRLGPRIFVEKIQFRFLITASLSSVIATADIFNNVRIIVAALGASQSQFNVASFPSVNSFVDLRQDYTILYDKTWYLKNVASGLAAAGASYGASPEGEYVTTTLNYQRHVLYNTTAGSSDVKGCPVINLVSDSSVTPNPNVYTAVRVWFRDVLGGQ